VDRLPGTDRHTAEGIRAREGSIGWDVLRQQHHTQYECHGEVFASFHTGPLLSVLVDYEQVMVDGY
jgi:hypothetical protein